MHLAKPGPRPGCGRRARTGCPPTPSGVENGRGPCRGFVKPPHSPAWDARRQRHEPPGVAAQRHAGKRFTRPPATTAAATARHSDCRPPARPRSARQVSGPAPAGGQFRATPASACRRRAPRDEAHRRGGVPFLEKWGGSLAVQPRWRRRTNVWRRITSPGTGPMRLRSSMRRTDKSTSRRKSTSVLLLDHPNRAGPTAGGNQRQGPNPPP